MRISMNMSRQFCPESLNVNADAALILIEQPATAGLLDLAGQVLLAVAHTGSTVLAVSQSSAAGNLSLVVPRDHADPILATLRSHLSARFTWHDRLRLSAITEVTLLTVVTPPTAESAPDAVQVLCDQLAAAGSNILMFARAWRTATLVVGTSLERVQHVLHTLHHTHTSTNP